MQHCHRSDCCHSERGAFELGARFAGDFPGAKDLHLVGEVVCAYGSREMLFLSAIERVHVHHHTGVGHLRMITPVRLCSSASVTDHVLSLRPLPLAARQSRTQRYAHMKVTTVT